MCDEFSLPCLNHVSPAAGHPHEHDVEVNLDHESHAYLHVLDETHYVRHLRPAASRNDSVVLHMDVALLAVHGLVSDLP